MAKFEVLVVLLQLPLIVLLLNWHTASSTAAARVVTPRERWSLGSQQLTAGGDFGVRVDLSGPTPSLSPTLHSDDSEKDGQMSPQASPQAQSDPPSPPIPPPQESETCSYTVKTQTGTQWTAGTDSTISVQFYNSEMESIFIVLTDGGLDTGHLDEFDVQGRCIPNICKMELATDASGSLPCWFADYVSVSVNSPDFTNSQMFVVQEWLPAHEWSPPTSITRDQCH